MAKRRPLGIVLDHNTIVTLAGRKLPTLVGSDDSMRLELLAESNIAAGDIVSYVLDDVGSVADLTLVKPKDAERRALNAALARAKRENRRS